MTEATRDVSTATDNSPASSGRGPRRRRWAAAGARALLGLMLIGALALCADAELSAAETAPPPWPIALQAVPLDSFLLSEPTLARFGTLQYLGGLEIKSSDRNFGGLSGLVTYDHGRKLIAVADIGFWFSASLDVDATGRLTGISDGQMAHLLDATGRPLLIKHEADAEGLAVRRAAKGSELLVSLEGDHRILAYPFSGDAERALLGHGALLPGLPAEIRGLSANRGLESVAVAPPRSPIAGAAVTIAERGRAGADNPGWILGGPKPGRFTVKRRDDLDIADAAFLPDGDLLLLDRAFDWNRGLRVRIRRIPATAIVAGASIDGIDLLSADLRYNIDNLEGLAVDQAADGGTILTIISDDNQSFLQRTVLLRFKLLNGPS